MLLFSAAGTRPAKDVIYLGDIERAISYSLQSAIPARFLKSSVTKDTIRAVYVYLYVVGKFAPVNDEIKGTVNQLKDWIWDNYGSSPYATLPGYELAQQFNATVSVLHSRES